MNESFEGATFFVSRLKCMNSMAVAVGNEVFVLSSDSKEAFDDFFLWNSFKDLI